VTKGTPAFTRRGLDTEKVSSSERIVEAELDAGTLIARYRPEGSDGENKAGAGRRLTSLRCGTVRALGPAAARA